MIKLENNKNVTFRFFKNIDVKIADKWNQQRSTKLFGTSHQPPIFEPMLIIQY